MPKNVKRNVTEDDLVELSRRHIRELAISPDGISAAVVTGYDDNLHEQYVKGIMQRSLWILGPGRDGRSPVCVDDGHAPAWSSSGGAIAYLCRTSGTTQIWCIRLNNGEKLQLTDLDWGDNAFVIHGRFSYNRSEYSPLTFTLDGEHILFALSKREDSKAAYCTPTNPVELEGGREESQTQQSSSVELWSVSVSGGQPSLLTELPHIRCCFVGWRENGELLVSCGSHFYSIAPSSGTCTLFAEEEHCLGAVDQSGVLWLVKAGQDYIMVGPVLNGEWQQSCEFPYQPSIDRPIAIQPDLGRLFLLRRSGVQQALIQADFSSGCCRTISEANEVVAALNNNYRLLSVSKHGSFWVPISTSDRPSELYTYSSSDTKRLVSDFNPLVEELDLPQVSRVAWQSDGWSIEGLLVSPAGTAGNPPYPTLVYLHPGPEIAVEQSFESINSPRAASAASLFAANGFAVLLVNFRGSAGYGKEFMSQLGDYHLYDRPLHDVFTGVEMLSTQGIIDPNAIGIYGMSYGAMLTIWAIGQTDMFRSALAACGNYDERRAARITGMPFHTLIDTRRGNADPEEIWQRPELWELVSPIENAWKIRTPLFLVETGADRRLIKQAQPVFNTLRRHNVESYMAYYPNAFHGGGWNEGYRYDYLRRALAWFRHTLKEEELPSWFLEPSCDCEWPKA